MPCLLYCLIRLGVGFRDRLLLCLHQKLRVDRKLVRGETHRLFGDLLAHTAQLKDDASWLDHCHPVIGRALAGTHARLGGLLRHRLIREDANPHFAAALDVAVHSDTRRLDLPRLEPDRLERLQRELTKCDDVATMRLALHAPAMLLAVLGSAWRQ